MTDRPADDPIDRPHDDLPEVDRAFELASALHDGEVDDGEVDGGEDDFGEDDFGEDKEAERVAVDEAVRSVAALARRLRDVPSPPPGLVDDHVAAAMAAFDQAPRAAAAGARVTSLAGRRPWWQRVPLGAVAAVIAVVAVVGAIGLTAGSGDDDDTTATAAFEVAGESGDDSTDSSPSDETAEDAAETGGAGAESFDADSGDEGAAAGGTAVTGDERPAYGSYAELAAALQAEAGERTTTGSQAAPEESTDSAEPESSVPPDAESDLGGAAGCDAVAAAGADPAAVQRVVPVVVDDRLVTAVVHAGEDGRRLASIDEVTCAVADDRPL